MKLRFAASIINVLGVEMLVRVLLVIWAIGVAGVALAQDSSDTRPVPGVEYWSIGVPSPSRCDSDVPPAVVSGAGDVGAWRSRDRFGQGWDFHADGAGAVSATFYTYDQQRRPVWYRSSVAGLDAGGRSFKAELQEHRWDPTKRSREIRKVGALAVRFVDSGQQRAVVRWKLDGTRGAAVQECLHYMGTDITAVWPEFPQTSRWVFDGYDRADFVLNRRGNQAHLASLTFDTEGLPVWSVGVGPVESLATGVSMGYRFSNYPGGDITLECPHAGCVSAERRAGIAQLQVIDTRSPSASLALAIQSAEVSQSVAETWPVSTGTAALRNPGAHSITVTQPAAPHICEIPSGQSNCQVNVSWSTINSLARLYRRPVGGSTSFLAIATGLSGSTSVNWGEGKYVFELRQGSSTGTLLVTSAEVTVVPFGQAPPPTNPIGFPSTSVCPANPSPVSPGMTPVVPGRWWNPQRSGTNWQVIFTDNGNLFLYWVTYDSNGQPTWLMSETSQITTTAGSPPQQQYWGRLIRFVHAGGGNVVPAHVGHVAISFIAGDATRAAIRWQWDGGAALGNATVPQSECIVEYSRDTFRSVNQALNGQWVESTMGGYGLNVYVGQGGPNGGFYENGLLLAYDTAGQPSWVGYEGLPSASSHTLFHVLSPYQGGVPRAAPVQVVPYLPSASGTLTRSFNSDARTGTAVISALNAARGIDWRRAPDGSAVAIEKLAGSRITEIYASQQRCTLGAGSSCTIRASWSSLDPSARAYEVRFDVSPVQRVALPFNGLQHVNFTDRTYTQAGSYRYELYAGSDLGQLLASSAAVVIAGSTGPATSSISATPPTCTAVAGSSQCAVTLNWATAGSTPDPVGVFRTLQQAGSTPVLRQTGRSGVNVTDQAPAQAGTTLMYRYSLRRCLDGACTQAGQVLVESDLISVVSAAASTDWQDTGVLSPPSAAGLPTLPATELVEVGSLAGQFRVDESGAASYQIPLYVAPATGGLAPQMGLAYSSTAGEGSLGVGFNLTGMSAIMRCRRSVESGDGPGPHPPVQFTEADAYCLDGQRLVEIGTLGGGRLFRTEIDGLANIIGYTEPGVNGIAFWRAYGKDGVERLYGLNGNVSHCASPTACNGRVMRNRLVGGAWQETSEVMSWMLSKMRSRDPNGGAIEFTYAINPRLNFSQPAQVTGEALLTQVTFSGADVGVRPTTARLEFLYAARSNPSVSYMSGTRIQATQRLTDIRSFNADGLLVRRYELHYEAQASPVSGRDRVSSIREFGPTNANFPATQFTWSTPSKAFAPAFESAEHQFSDLMTFKYGDVDGDGRAEIIWLKGQAQSANAKLWITRTEMVGGGMRFVSTETARTVADNRLDRDRSWQIFDYNQDGMDDLLIAELSSPTGYSGQWRVYLANGVGGFSSTPVNLPQAIPFTATADGESEAVTDAQVADFNGDGLVDLMTPFLDGSQVRLQIRHGRRAAPGTNCTVAHAGGTITNNDCPYEFGPPRTVALALPGGTSLEIRGRDTERYEVFDANGDGRADLRLSVTCNTGCLDNPLRSAMTPTLDYGMSAYEPDPMYQWPDGDAPHPPAPEGGQHKYWVLFTHQDSPSNLENFAFYERWKHEGLGATVSGADQNFRVADINGDGLADVVYERKGADSWWFSINRGDGYSAESCVLPPFGASTCPVIDNSDTVQLLDHNQDGRLDFWVAQEGDTDQLCQGGSDSNQIYQVLEGRDSMSGNGASFSFKFDNAQRQGACPDMNLRAFGEDWNRAITDLDGDGNLDIWGHNDATGGCPTTNNPICYRTARRTDRWMQADVVTEIRNGLGAQTRIQYAPMNFSTVYRRDHFGPFMSGAVPGFQNLTPSGRGSPVFDLSGPQYLVRFVSSSAPNDDPTSAADPWVRVAYRYVGAKAQGNGRGALGMRKLASLDLQTNVETETEYRQTWPLNGRPQTSFSYNLRNTVHNHAVCGQAPGAAWGNGDLPGCLVRAPVCGDLRAPCDHSNHRPVFSEGYDTYAFRARTGPSTLAANVGSLPLPAGPTSFFVYQQQSRKLSYQIDSNDPNADGYGVVKDEVSTFEGPDGAATPMTMPGYDGNGNLLGSSVVLRDGFGLNLQIIRSSFVYDVPAGFSSLWVPGMLTQSSVTSMRSAQSRTRQTHFEYTEYGSIKAEHVQPTGSLDERLSTHTVRNAYGQPIGKITCSGHFSAAQCTSGSVLNGRFVPSGVIADPSDPRVIRRYEAYGYDALSRFVNVTSSAFDSAEGNDSPAQDVVHTTVLERNVYGEPTRVLDANGVEARTDHTQMGRALRSYVLGSGSSTVTTTRWCISPEGGGVSTVPCPPGAVYREETVKQGAPTTRAYFDVLGRVILSETQSFQANQWSAVATAYDRLGRVILTTEPYFSGGAVRDIGCVNARCTRQQYDLLGRVTQITHPDHSPSRPVITQIRHFRASCPIELIGGNTFFTRCFTKATTDALGRVSTEDTSPMGDMVETVDAAGLFVVYRHDPHGNLRLVSRSANNGDSAGQQIITTITHDDLGRRTHLIDPDLGTWTYSYNALGEQIEERNANGQCVTSRTDVRGRMVERLDYTNATCSLPAQSFSRWQYDLGHQRFGLLANEREGTRNASGIDNVRTLRVFEYDALKRPIATSTSIASAAGTRNYRQEQTYDQHSRPFQTFDLVFAAGTPDAINASTARRLGVQYEYNAQGHQQRIVNAQLNAQGQAGTDVYYEVLSVNARGQVTQDRRGGTVALDRTLYFNPDTGRLTGIESGIGGVIQSLDYGRNHSVNNGYDELGNLRFRIDLRTGLREDFGYDNLYRLTQVSRSQNGTALSTQSMSYDQLGNFISKGALSYRSRIYDNQPQCARQTLGPHMVSRVSSSSGSTVYCYDANGNQVSAGDGNPNSTAPNQRLLSYAVHDKPLSVRTTGSTGSNGRLTTYQYGPGREIVKRLDGPANGLVDIEVDYVGGVEVSYRPDAGGASQRREYKRYLANYLVLTMRSEVVAGQVQRSSTRHYRFEDKLGSIDVLTTATGSIVQRMSFDVYGERRNELNWAALSQTEITSFNSEATRKGYTGHEHVDQANLIHMGGRIYDPHIGRFLSADPLIQAPHLSQSLNRYSYVMNNPMNYVDPSGYSWISDNWRTVASIAISFYLPGMQFMAGFDVATIKILTGMASGAMQTGTLKGALTGGLSAGLFHQIGAHFDQMAIANKGADNLIKGTGVMVDGERIGGLTAGQFAGKIAAHAAAGGVMTVLQGGKFGHGFATAGFGEAVSPAVVQFAGDSAGKAFIAGVLVGGTTSALVGGKFANGAVTAAFQWAFNHFGGQGFFDGGYVSAEQMEHYQARYAEKFSDPAAGEMNQRVIVAGVALIPMARAAGGIGRAVLVQSLASTIRAIEAAGNSHLAFKAAMTGLQGFPRIQRLRVWAWERFADRISQLHPNWSMARLQSTSGRLYGGQSGEAVLISNGTIYRGNAFNRQHFSRNGEVFTPIVNALKQID